MPIRRAAIRPALGAVALCLFTLNPSAARSPVASGSRLMSESLTPPTPDLDRADSLFRAGHFAEAEQSYARVAAREPDNRRALVQLGHLALLGNRFLDAERWLGRARALDPADSTATRLLADAWYRQDRFADVADLLRGRESKLRIRVLDGFKGRVPYRIEGGGDTTELKFLQTDPIPVVAVRVNGHEANFIIDTGGSEVYLEPEFAARIGAALVTGSEAGGFAGGQTKEMQRGRIDSLGLGAFTVHDLPVNIVDTKFIGRDAVAKGLNVAGFIGTILLYHFLPTLDYPNGQLLLRRKTARNLAAFEQAAARGVQTVLPFWLAGDHFMVTWASAHRSKPSLFLIDTGGAGIGFVPGPSFVAEAGIELPPPGPDGQAIGAVPVRYFTTDEVSLGPLTERDIRSVFGAFPAFLETRMGFRMAGIVSHEFFKHYAFTMDFVGMRFFLERPR